jgi:transposase
MSADDSLPDDMETLKQLVRAGNAELAQARAAVSNSEALIAHLRLTIEKMRREMFGPKSERKARLLDQLELQLEELAASAAEDEQAGEQAASSSKDAR